MRLMRRIGGGDGDVEGVREDDVEGLGWWRVDVVGGRCEEMAVGALD